MKIGIIGCGNIGGTLAHHWVKAGHEVLISSRHPEKLKVHMKGLGPKARVGTPIEAARFGDVVLISIPLGEVVNLSKELVGALKEKIVIDTCNPYPGRDGQAGVEALKSPSGSGVWIAKHLPGARVVKAFNTIYFKQLESEAHRKGEFIGVPLASDDRAALETVSKLVQDAGFGPVIVGELRRAKEFDNGTKPYASGASVSELHKMFGQKKKAA